jgi:hypothetical protein
MRIPGSLSFETRYSLSQGPCWLARRWQLSMLRLDEAICALNVESVHLVQHSLASSLLKNPSL